LFDEDRGDANGEEESKHGESPHKKQVREVVSDTEEEQSNP